MDNPTAKAERHFLIVGGGPAGLTAGYQLTKAGYKPDVFEKSYTVGGISRTEQYKGYHFDMGGHRFFTKARQVNDMWHEVLKEDFLKRPRLSRIFYNKKFFSYPLDPINALTGLGLIESVLIGISYFRWRLFRSKIEDNFEQWVTNRFGKRLFNTFFKTYTEKVWGISCTELKAEWAAQRIQDLSLKTAVLNAFIKPKNAIKSLIEQFEYPSQGPGMMWRVTAEKINDAGGEVHMESDVVAFHREGNRIVGVTVSNDGVEQRYDGTDCISSMPITEFIKKVDPPVSADLLASANALNYRDFLTVCLIIDHPDLFPDNWIYIHDDSVVVGRIQNFKNWSPAMVPDQSKTSLGMEYFCNVGDDLWNLSDEELIALGTKEIGEIGLAKGAKVIDGCVFKVPKAYPVYDGGYEDHLAKMREFVETLENFQTIGRNGMHRYNNQDHAMLTAMYAVQNSLTDANLNLWTVNAEQEYHEEIEGDDKTPRKIGRNPNYIEVDEDVGLVGNLHALDRVAFGAGAGAVAGLSLFLMTLVLVLQAGPETGKTLGLLRNYMPGYEVTFAGSFLGLVYGFIGGFVGGWLTALVRNGVWFFWFRVIRRRAERGFLRDLLDFI
ncbi:MAG: protoporphyrinogen oxidase [Pseudohongiellaceae bacterium]